MLSEYEIQLFQMKSELCKTFSDPKRLMIIHELRSGEKQVGELAQELNLPQTVVSGQLAILRNKGVVVPRREGTNVYYSIADTKILEACDAVHQVLLNNLAKNREIAERLLT
jgi:DNA-binding transcriptional ArsR family regulator